MPPFYIPLIGLSNKDWFSVQIMTLLTMNAAFNIFLPNSVQDFDLKHSLYALHLEWKIQFTTIRSVVTRGAIKPLKTERSTEAETWRGRLPLVWETRNAHPAVATTTNTPWKLANSKQSWKDSLILKHNRGTKTKSSLYLWAPSWRRK
jgi:hypothetical protein